MSSFLRKHRYALSMKPTGQCAIKGPVGWGRSDALLGKENENTLSKNCTVLSAYKCDKNAPREPFL